MLQLGIFEHHLPMSKGLSTALSLPTLYIPQIAALPCENFSQGISIVIISTRFGEEKEADYELPN